MLHAAPASLQPRLRMLQPWQAEASRVLFDARTRHLLPEGCSASAAWVDGAPTNVPDSAVVLRFVGPRGRVSTRVSCSESDMLAQAVDPSIGPQLQSTLLQFATHDVVPWLEALGLAGPNALEVEQVPVFAPANEAQIEIGWSRHHGDAGRVRLVHADALAVRSVRSALFKVAPAHTFRALRVTGRLLLGERTMPVARADALRCGDVILPQGTLETGSSLRGVLLFGEPSARHWTAPASWLEHTITIEGVPLMSHGKAKAAASGDAAPNSAMRISDIDIPIAFEVETTTITLAALESIQPGYVFELPMAAAGATVRLTVYGQAVGQGELVSVGEQLGVRILRIGASNAVDSGC
jgi:type III secretion protein Q